MLVPSFFNVGRSSHILTMWSTGNYTYFRLTCNYTIHSLAQSQPFLPHHPEPIPGYCISREHLTWSIARSRVIHRLS